MNPSDIPCKQNCDKAQRCLYSLAMRAIAEIEEARAKGLGNGININHYFDAYFENGRLVQGKFVVRIYPVTEEGKVEETYIFQFSSEGVIRKGWASCLHDYWSEADGWKASGNSGDLFKLPSRPDDKRYPPKSDEEDLISYLKQQAGL